MMNVRKILDTTVHRIPCPTFVTIAKRPFVWAGTAADVEVIWVKGERKYFWERDWTGGIKLKNKEDFRRERTRDEAAQRCHCIMVTPETATVSTSLFRRP